LKEKCIPDLSIKIDYLDLMINENLKADKEQDKFS